MILFIKPTTALIKADIDRGAVRIGTPVNANGVETNGAGAYGIVLNPSATAWGMLVVTGGYINKSEAEAAYGSQYSDACISALSGISFVAGDKFTPANVGISVMANQAASTADTVAKLKGDVNSLLTKLKAAGLMEADSENGGK